MQQLILGSFAGEWFMVQTEAQARLLADPLSLGFLKPFIGVERSATQAARELGCSVQRLQYRLNQFLQAGLLRETRLQPRAGRPVRCYRAVADGFQLPFELTPFADLEAQTARQYAPYDRLRNRAIARRGQQRGQPCRCIYRDALTGEVHNETARLGLEAASTVRTGNDVVLSLRLNQAQAERFTRELNELYARLQEAQLPPDQGQPYLVHFGLLPLSVEGSA